MAIFNSSSSICDLYQGRSQDKRVATVARVATTVALQQVRDRLSLRGWMLNIDAETEKTSFGTALRQIAPPVPLVPLVASLTLASGNSAQMETSAPIFANSLMLGGHICSSGSHFKSPPSHFWCTAKTGNSSNSKVAASTGQQSSSLRAHHLKVMTIKKLKTPLNFSRFCLMMEPRVKFGISPHLQQIRFDGWMLKVFHGKIMLCSTSPSHPLTTKPVHYQSENGTRISKWKDFRLSGPRFLGLLGSFVKKIWNWKASNDCLKLKGSWWPGWKQTF